MEKKIPLYFDAISVSSPINPISESNPNVWRLKVRVFTKYGNRNGSYITDAIAEQLIESATKGITPVVGFFDPETQTWASHTGPKVSNGYGYVESFLGWEPFTDTDGVTRDYAVFSVILFIDYFEEARKVLGENQSMELDPESIDGTWAVIDKNEYFVYTKAKMASFCIIGQHEPCFSVSSFFEKNEETNNAQYEQFSSLLSDLKTLVEEAKQNNKGGEQSMNEQFENQVVEPEVAEIAAEPEIEATATEQFDNNSSEKNEENFENSAENIEEEKETNDFSNEGEAAEKANEFEILQQNYNELENNYNELISKYQALETELNNFRETSRTDMDALRATNEELQTSVKNYEAQMQVIEKKNKENLIAKYEKLINAEQIDAIRNDIDNLDYAALESKLAITFANQKISGEETTPTAAVPLPEQQSSFALLMSKYKK